MNPRELRERACNTVSIGNYVRCIIGRDVDVGVDAHIGIPGHICISGDFTTLEMRTIKAILWHCIPMYITFEVVAANPPKTLEGSKGENNEKQNSC
jgi:hypothetical protein